MVSFSVRFAGKFGGKSLTSSVYGFVKVTSVHRLKTAVLNKEYQTAIYNRLNKKGKLSLIQIN